MEPLRAYDEHRKVQILGEMWKATRKGHTLRVQLRTHPLGWELLAFVGLEMHRSEIARSERDVFALSERWRTEAEAKGWSLEAATD